MTKIISLETFCNEFVGFVRITDETGTQSWGQVYRILCHTELQSMDAGSAPCALAKSC